MKSQYIQKPNLFIIGAPRCGTTSLAMWLSAHPMAYMSPIKEPHFFNTDHYRVIESATEYNALFQNATQKHKVIGEASVWYLYSKEAVTNILRYNRMAKFIVMLRNPVDMVYSLHDQLLCSLYENVRNFEEAWHLQEKRLKDTIITRRFPEPKYLQYGKVCSLGKQLEQLFSKVPAERIHIVLFDNFKANALREYEKIQIFLGLQICEDIDLKSYNEAKEWRSIFLQRLILWTNDFKKRLQINGGYGIMSAIRRKNMRVRTRTTMSPKTHSMLIDYFYNDIQLMEKLLQRDLGHWLH